MRDLIYIFISYLMGSVLFANVSGALIAGKDITEGSRDGNPGTANAFMNGGLLCGVITLLGDLLKSALPVYLYMRQGGGEALPLVIAAPVVGHIFPIFHRFRGGKGIAATFGCFLGLLPDIVPLGSLAFFFILFSTALRITPHYHRTLLTYLFAGIALLLFEINKDVVFGFGIIAAAVFVRLAVSKEEKPKCEVHLLWTR